MEAIRQRLFESGTLQIGLFEMHPVSDACGDVERQDSNVVVLPLSGVFSKHEAPRRYVVGTPCHAVFIAADTPYRLSFPGAIGDRALTLRFGEDLVSERLSARGGNGAVASHGLLSAKTMMLRNQLLARSQDASADEFEIETLGLDLLDMSVRSLYRDDAPVRRATLLRRARALARVKEAVALAPAEKWSIARLAKVADLSPFHLCHVFRQMTGASLHDYILQERLAHSLNAVVDGGDDLTTIAIDAGFASHSHFTARFRRFFGCSPGALRRTAASPRIADLRKIVTARRPNFPNTLPSNEGT